LLRRPNKADAAGDYSKAPFGLIVDMRAFDLAVQNVPMTPTRVVGVEIPTLPPSIVAGEKRIYSEDKYTPTKG